MSILNLKWTKGAPKSLLPGMVVRLKEGVYLIGTINDLRLDCADILEHAQAIHSYELDWLEDMGVPAKAAV